MENKEDEDGSTFEDTEAGKLRKKDFDDAAAAEAKAKASA